MMHQFKSYRATGGVDFCSPVETATVKESKQRHKIEGGVRLSPARKSVGKVQKESWICPEVFCFLFLI